MSLAKKKIMWGILFLLVWPVWFWTVALFGLGGDESAFKYIFIVMLIPGFVAVGFFISARKLRLANQTATISQQVRPLERTGKVVKSICFVIGILIVLSMLPNLFFGSLGPITPSDYPSLLYGLTGVGLILYSFKK